MVRLLDITIIFLNDLDMPTGGSSTTYSQSKFDGKTIDALHRSGRFQGYNNTEDIKRDLLALDKAAKKIESRKR